MNARNQRMHKATITTGRALTLEGAKRKIALLTANCEKYEALLGEEKEKFAQELENQTDQLHRRLEFQTDLAMSLADKKEEAEKPIPMRLQCPECHALHIDEGEFATKPHHTHACQSCGNVWRPAVRATIGVRFLPGFKNDEEPEPNYADIARRIFTTGVTVEQAERLGGFTLSQARQLAGLKERD